MKMTLSIGLTTAMLLSSINMSAQSLSVDPVEVQTGEQTELSVSLTGGTAMTALQFNVQLPDGVTVNANSATLGTATDGHTLSVQPLASGDLLFILYSMEQKAFSDGEILRIPLKTGNAATTANGKLYNVRVATAAAVSHPCADATFNIIVRAFAIGDVNHDRNVNITDVMMTVNHVVGQTPAGFHVENADVNGDHVVNISDIMAIVNLVVNATSANAPSHAREAMTDAISLTPTTQGYAIALQNIEPYTALQMDIQLPNDAPLNVRLADNRSDGHSIICSDLGNGHHRIAVYSLNGHAIMGNGGILLQLETYGKHETLPEVYNVQLTNNIFENVTLSDISFPTDITNVNTDEHTDLPTYNVQGIHAPKHYRGIIIQDGRKHVEKK